MIDAEWMAGLPMNVIVCDKDFMITEMNEHAVARYAEEGGRELIGRCLLDCHNPDSRTKIKTIAETGKANIYYVEKMGIRKLVYQAPLIREGVFSGLVEMVLTLPADVSTVKRD